MGAESVREAFVEVARNHSFGEGVIACRRLGLGNFGGLLDVYNFEVPLELGSFVELLVLGSYAGEGRSRVESNCSCSGVGVDWKASDVWGIVAELIVVQVDLAVCFDRRVEAHCCRIGNLRVNLGGADWVRQDLAAAVVAAVI